MDCRQATEVRYGKRKVRSFRTWVGDPGLCAEDLQRIVSVELFSPKPGRPCVGQMDDNDIELRADEVQPAQRVAERVSDSLPRRAAAGQILKSIWPGKVCGRLAGRHEVGSKQCLEPGELRHIVRTVLGRLSPTKTAQ